MDIKFLVMFSHVFLQNLGDKIVIKVRVTRLPSFRFVRWISCQGVVLTVKCVLAYYGARHGRGTLKPRQTVPEQTITAGLISKMLRSVSKLRLSWHPGQPNSFDDSMSILPVVRLGEREIPQSVCTGSPAEPG